MEEKINEHREVMEWGGKGTSVGRGERGKGERTVGIEGCGVGGVASFGPTPLARPLPKHARVGRNTPPFHTHTPERTHNAFGIVTKEKERL
jgi:hypothetical protein